MYDPMETPVQIYMAKLEAMVEEMDDINTRLQIENRSLRKQLQQKEVELNGNAKLDREVRSSPEQGKEDEG